MLLGVYFHTLALRSAFPLVFLTGIFPYFTSAQLLFLAASTVLPHRSFDILEEFTYDAYQRLICFFFETYCGSEVLFYGDDLPVDVKENVIYLCNHQSSVDWVVSDLIAIRQGSLGRLRYILKSGLKQLPMYGFTFAQHGGVYISKKDQKNEDCLARKLKQLVDRKTRLWMVIFPEGTRYNPNKPDVIKQSQKFAKEEDLPIHEHVLVPRSRGTQALVENLGDYVDAVYDVTIAYRNENKPLLPRQEGPSLTEFVAEAGEQVHIHFNRIQSEEVPREPTAVKKWLQDLFSEKERLLTHFYENGKFPGESKTIPLPAYRTVPYFVVCGCLLAAALATPRNRGMYAKLTVALSGGTLLYMNTLFNTLQMG